MKCPVCHRENREGEIFCKKMVGRDGIGMSQLHLKCTGRR